jgi:hypothetical protein
MHLCTAPITLKYLGACSNRNDLPVIHGSESASKVKHAAIKDIEAALFILTVLMSNVIAPN